MRLSVSLSTQRTYRVAVGTFFFIQGVVFATWASRIPDIKELLKLSEAGLGGVLLALPAGQLSAMALSGYLVSRYGSRKMLGLAAFLYPSMLVLIGTVTSVWQLLLGLFFFGMCGNLSNISVNTQAIGVERLYRRSIMASFHGIWSLAGFTGGIIASFMVGSRISPFNHFCVIYGITLVLMFIARNYILPRDMHRAAGGAPERRNIFVKPDKFILMLGLLAFASMICEGTMFDWSGIYFEQVVRAPRELTRTGYVAFMATMAGGRFAGDWLITRFGVLLVLRTSGLLILSGMLISVIWPQVIPATAGFLLVGAGTSSVVPLAYSLAGKSQTLLPGVALAVVSSIGYLGFLIGPPLIGFIAELLSLRGSFALIAILGLGATILAGKISGALKKSPGR